MSAEAERSLTRALETLRAVRRHLYDARRCLYGQRRAMRQRGYEALWPFASAWSALGTLASVGGGSEAGELLRASTRGLAAYHREHGRALRGTGPIGFESAVVPPLGGGGELYYDDNAWVALALLQQHRVLGDARALPLVRRILDFVMTGWSGDRSWARPGGIRWKVPVANRSRNTCSNGPTIEVAARLHALTGERACLEQAARVYGWVAVALRRSDNLYADRIDPGGAVHHELWSYNQGTMLGAGVLLYESTGEKRYLDEATATARACLRHFTPEVLSSQLPAFNAVFFRNLLLLHRHRPDTAFLALAHAYGEIMWNEHRERRRTLFVGSGPPLNNSAPMIEVYALLAGAQAHA